MHGTPFGGRAVQDAGEPFFFNASFPHENFSSGENWNHYSPLLCALFIVVDICIRYKRFPARLATIATRKQRSKPAQNGLLFFAAKPPKTKKRPLRQQKKLHFDFSKCSFPFGATGRIRTGDLLITNQLLYQLSHSSTFILGRHKRLYLLYEFFVFRQEVFLLFSSPGQKSSCPPQTLPGQRKLLFPGNAPPHTKQPSYACPRPPGPAIRPPVPCCCAACAVATACPFTTREYVCPSASWPQAKMMLFACFTPAPS